MPKTNLSASPATFLLTADWSNFSDLFAASTWTFRTRDDAMAFHPGARGIVYLTAGSGPYAAIAGIIEAASPCIAQASKLWPYSVALKPPIRPASPLPVGPHLAALSFVPSGRTWGLAFKGRGVRRIPASDYQILANAIASAQTQR
jgi:hypothetical protein